MGRVGCNNKRSLVMRIERSGRRWDCQTHYWALRQQARARFRVAHRWVGRYVVASLWWWGVVFDLWIVVASIKCSSVNGFPFVGGLFVVLVLLCNFF